MRTGLGGKKVVLDGGAVVLPIFHSTARVNLKIAAARRSSATRRTVC